MTLAHCIPLSGIVYMNNFRFYIILALAAAAVAVTVTVVVMREDRDAMTQVEYRELIREAIDSGDYELVGDIPPGVYGDVEVVEEIDSKGDPGIRRALTRIRKVIRDRSKYAKAPKSLPRECWGEIRNPCPANTGAKSETRSPASAAGRKTDGGTRSPASVFSEDNSQTSNACPANAGVQRPTLAPRMLGSSVQPTNSADKTGANNNSDQAVWLGPSLVCKKHTTSDQPNLDLVTLDIGNWRFVTSGAIPPFRSHSCGASVGFPRSKATEGTIAFWYSGCHDKCSYTHL